MTFSVFNIVNKVFETNHLMKGIVCNLWCILISCAIRLPGKFDNTLHIIPSTFALLGLVLFWHNGVLSTSNN